MRRLTGKRFGSRSRVSAPEGVARPEIEPIRTREEQMATTRKSPASSNKPAPILDKEGRVAAFFDALTDAFVLLSPEQDIVMMNKAAMNLVDEYGDAMEDAFGFSMDEFVGKSALSFAPNRRTAAKVFGRGDLPATFRTTVGDHAWDIEVAPYVSPWNAAHGYAVRIINADKAMLGARSQAMLENSPSAMIFANRDLSIQYMNPQSFTWLRQLEQYLPVKADAMIGQNMDIFHQDPSYQRGILSKPENLPHNARIKVGPEILDLLVTAIYDDHGSYMGPMLSWSIITDKVEAEMNAARYQSMVENAPINMMLADKETLTIKYVNPASERTLRSIAHLLPIPPDKVVGACIDVFHKDPSHQRAILKDPGNLPIETQIQLGDEILALNVAPIRDADGEYVGPLVAWSVITETVRADERAAQLQREAEEASEALNAGVNTILKVVEAAAQGDLTKTVEVNDDGAIGSMAEGMSGFLNDLRSSISGIANTAGQVATQSGDIRDASGGVATNVKNTLEQSNAVSQAAGEVSANVQVVASGVEEMNASIREIANNANEAARVAGSAVSMADETNTTISRLGDASAEIGQVIKVITSIAQQTNLLALNATIEAARAGEAGKGFAVVANEVKELAKETAKATEDIGRKIEAIQTNTRQAVDAIQQISDVINKINDIQSNIASAVEEQSVTTAEIGQNVSEAARGSANIADNIGVVVEAAASSDDQVAVALEASKRLADAASELESLVERFTY